MKTKSFDYKAFQKEEGPFQIKYGLPHEIQFCRKCVISNQRPNSTSEYSHRKESVKATIYLDENGVCDACRIAEIKSASINWEERERELRELCDRYRKNDGTYDCLIPGSGGKDSFYAAYVLKYKYGMNPLTVTWAPHIYTDWGWKNFQAWIHMGFDNFLITPNGRVHRLLTRLSTDILLHPFQVFIIGQKSTVPRFAMEQGINLVFYGENEAEYGNPIADNNRARRDWSYFAAPDPEKIFIGGVSLKELEEDYGVAKKDMIPYLPPDPESLERNKTEVHYLGYYLKWHPQSVFYHAVEHGGFIISPERNPGTYSKYNSIDDKLDDLHYYTTCIKFGIGRATYDAAQEIRSGDITREEGVALVKKFDGEYPARFEEEVFRYLSINEKEFPRAIKKFVQPIFDRDYFESLCNEFRSEHIWHWTGSDWKLRRTVWADGAEISDMEKKAMEWTGNRVSH